MPSLEGSQWFNNEQAKQLHARLRQHADYTEPDQTYVGKVWTRGVMPTAELRERIGGIFGQEINGTSGSRVEFCRDRLAGEFVLNRLVMPFEQDGKSGSIYVQGLQVDKYSSYEGTTTEYIGYSKLANETSENTLLWCDDEAEQLSRMVMNGHDLPAFTDRSSGRYRMWMGMHVLGKARAWDMFEKFQLGMSHEHSLNILRDQGMPEDVRDRSDNITIMHTKSLADKPGKPVLQRSLSFKEEMGTQNISHASTLWTRGPGDKMTPKTRYESLSTNVFKYFRRLVNEAVGEV